MKSKPELGEIVKVKKDVASCFNIELKYRTGPVVDTQSNHPDMVTVELYTASGFTHAITVYLKEIKHVR